MLQKLSSDLNRERREDSRRVEFFKFGRVLKLRHGGATTGRHAGSFKLAGEERSGAALHNRENEGHSRFFLICSNGFPFLVTHAFYTRSMP
jgi:hypothetical protein